MKPNSNIQTPMKISPNRAGRRQTVIVIVTPSSLQPPGSHAFPRDEVNACENCGLMFPRNSLIDGWCLGCKHDPLEFYPSKP